MTEAPVKPTVELPPQQTRDVAGILHFLTPQQMAAEIVRLDAVLAGRAQNITMGRLPVSLAPAADERIEKINAASKLAMERLAAIVNLGSREFKADPGHDYINRDTVMAMIPALRDSIGHISAEARAMWQELRAALTLPPAAGQEPVAWQDPECPRHVISAEDKRDFTHPRLNGFVARTIAERCTRPLYAALPQGNAGGTENDCEECDGTGLDPDMPTMASCPVCHGRKP